MNNWPLSTVGKAARLAADGFNLAPPEEDGQIAHPALPKPSASADLASAPMDRAIPSMERLEEGIAEFENAIKQYEDAGGEVYNDEAKKMDLLKVLPGDLGESLIWKAAEPGGFTALKDHIITMMGRILQVKKKLPLHAVVPEPGSSDDGGRRVPCGLRPMPRRS